jgi:predicted XRE-type DNA-binding protein
MAIRRTIAMINGMSETGAAAMTDAFEIVRGRGNVFADFGDADAEAKKMKAVIAAEIIATLSARGLSAREGAKVAKVDAADIQRIRNADLSRFTIDRLVRVT